MINDLKEVCEIIKSIGEAKGKSKEKILRQNKDNEILRKVLLYTYDRNMKFGFSKKSIVIRDGESKWDDLFVMLDELSESNINNDLKINVGRFLSNVETENEVDLITKIILKDLKIGISLKTINKAMDNLIYDFQVMKASAYDDKSKESFKNKAEKVGYTMMIKWNGVRGEIIKADDNIVVKSRQDKVVEGFDELNEAMKGMPSGYLYEGEILAVGDFKTSKEQFKKTQEIYSTDGNKNGLMIKLFDLIPLEDFYKGEWNKKLSSRKCILKSFIQENNNPLIQFADILYEGTDVNLIESMLNKVSENGLHEGLMVALNDNKYETKRVKTILKCKLFKTIDLRVIDIEESKEVPNTMGSAVVLYNGRKVGVSGWKQYDKEYYWENKNELIGKIIEVKYKEVTEDKDGNESLQFPNIVRIRNDKDEESYE